MRRFHGRAPWTEDPRVGFEHNCCKEFDYGRNYGYAPGYSEHYPFYPPYGYDRGMEKEFLEHRLQNIQEQERYIKERLNRLDELEKKDNFEKSDKNN